MHTNILDNNIRFQTITDHTFGVCPRTLPARASEPCTLPRGERISDTTHCDSISLAYRVGGVSWDFPPQAHISLPPQALMMMLFSQSTAPGPSLTVHCSYLKNNDSVYYMKHCLVHGMSTIINRQSVFHVESNFLVGERNAVGIYIACGRFIKS